MDAFVDSKELIDTWEGQGRRRSPELTSVTKELFFFFFCPLEPQLPNQFDACIIRGKHCGWAFAKII